MNHVMEIEVNIWFFWLWMCAIVLGFWFIQSTYKRHHCILIVKSTDYDRMALRNACVVYSDWLNAKANWKLRIMLKFSHETHFPMLKKIILHYNDYNFQMNMSSIKCQTVKNETIHSWIFWWYWLRKYSNGIRFLFSNLT